jgi:hypothetical protein
LQAPAPDTFEYVPFGQIVHVLALVAPVTPEYVPDKQF